MLMDAWNEEGILWGSVAGLYATIFQTANSTSVNGLAKHGRHQVILNGVKLSSCCWHNLLLFLIELLLLLLN